MRTLLVDNYDSFTYNLFHYLSRVNGQEPEVIRNDDPAWRPGLLDAFDNVVLSPGPGTPHRPADFGLCAEIATEGRLPVLGVCLGHQGMALAHGARVGRAPEPRHGRTSAVRHDGTGLFEGLPQPLEVVRYHSLAVTDLPPDLEGTAFSPDGVLMALRHRTLPLWGVQFHPESIGTREGHRLLENFRGLTERHGRPRVRPAGPTQRRIDPEPVAPVRELRVLVEQLPARFDPEVAFDTLFRGGEHPFWLDSSRPGDRLGQLSVLGDASGPLARIAKADVTAGTVTVTEGGATRTVDSPFLTWLEQDLAGLRTEVPALPFEFALGWVGYLGYELKAECDGEAAHRSPDPDATLVFADRALVVDHHSDTGYLLALAEDGHEDAARAWLTETAGTLEGIAGQRPGPCAEVPECTTGPVELRHDRDAYLKLIDVCQQEIAAGETYEVCLTNMAEADTDLDPWHAYRALRRVSAAPFAAFLHFGQVAVLSSSPERFLRIDRHGAMESKPIKGTRPRGATEQADALLAEDLATCEKDRAENLMIVDLVRHDLGRCAAVGSVVADPVFQVESYASVHQLVSTVRARLRADSSPVAAVRAAFPGGSMTGAPKIRTMQIIDRLEGGPRGVYSGAIGYFSLTGAVDLSIVIRTMVLSGNRLRYGVGGAVIALSDPAAEFEETAVKATPLLRLLGAAFPGRDAPGADPDDPTVVQNRTQERALP
ncbi:MULTISPECIES: aminodeoxychorismate synthase component I [Streptomyces]|uniref:Aminodeoxychorismate synthase n=1 Tax=Streptomyces doudnae TaxID=3075536 RepID=A0ABD5ELE2_9ACTN|nr:MULTISPECIES: aminodeoxychorismate synthase component I [unclassified Streptomyces]MDT0435497.1 aminodeoxychorismate synthase component I [Streptomyces sp. DSM 41981]MYQ67901.1 aminodeoxychorismate synthase component I [Streptomyces sp. SID4950]SCE41164.1 para-aminobenzoate synthetase [Streptomyces sp. SolWspMP-5a-2]